MSKTLERIEEIRKELDIKVPKPEVPNNVIYVDFKKKVRK